MSPLFRNFKLHENNLNEHEPYITTMMIQISTRSKLYLIPGIRAS